MWPWTLLLTTKWYGASCCCAMFSSGERCDCDGFAPTPPCPSQWIGAHAKLKRETDAKRKQLERLRQAARTARELKGLEDSLVATLNFLKVSTLVDGGGVAPRSRCSGAEPARTHTCVSLLL